MTMDDARTVFLTAAEDLEDAVQVGRLPAVLCGAAAEGGPGFEALWGLHPEHFHLIHLHGRKVHTPRWQQAFGADYRYSGQVNAALPVPPVLAPYLAWAKEALDPRLSGVLCNWYDGQRGHYIGAHRDSIANLVPGAPIVTISLGEARVFRLRPYRPQGCGLGRDPNVVDIPVDGGSVVVLSWGVNRRFTHEVPGRRAATGRRLSITLRAFRS